MTYGACNLYVLSANNTLVDTRHRKFPSQFLFPWRQSLSQQIHLCTVTLISRSQQEVPETMLWAHQLGEYLWFSEKEERGKEGARKKQSRADVEDGDEEREELKEGERQRTGEDSEKGSVCGGRGLNMVQSKRPVL